VAKKNGNAMAKIAPLSEQYPALRQDDTAELVRANLQDADMNVFDLERVRIPTGGGAEWQVPTLTGERAEKVLRGILIYYQNCRAYWAQEFQGGAPPDCASEDGRIGTGEPGGPCGKCPYAQWGSDPKGGRGQACKQIKRLFLLQPETRLPVMVSLPPTSIRGSKQYMLRLLNAGLPYWSVVTEIGLNRTKNQQGIAYSEATFAAAADEDDKPIILAPAEAERAKAYGEAIKAVISSIPVGAEDYVVSNGEDSA